MSESLENIREFNRYLLRPSVAEKFTFLEYIWIDGSGQQIRSKTKVCQGPINELSQVEWWTYDGSSTLQAITNDSEIYLKPVCLATDPFRGAPHKLVLCETYRKDRKTPARFNFRFVTKIIMDKANDQVPRFGIEQDYYLLKRTGTTHTWPLGWPNGGFPHPQERNNFGRAIAESHLRLCLEAGLKMGGVNAKSAPSQWEFQVGVCDGVEAADHLWLARYILERLGEEFGIDVNYDPKPVDGCWNGSGAHVNFSNEHTRSEGGLDYIVKTIMPELEKTHKDVLALYGANNEKRLTGVDEADFTKFNWGEGSRCECIRIPFQTREKKSGYFEDRRPAANIDPYLVTALLTDITCLDGYYVEYFKHLLVDAAKPLEQ